MMVPIGSLPLEQRADAARRLIELGEDPWMMLAATVWPKHVAFYVEPPTPGLGFCKRGHPWDEQNTTWRGPGKKWRRCKACDRLLARRWRQEHETHVREYRKVPCVYCGEPATHPTDKGSKGSDEARCRRCYQAQWVSRKRNAA